MPYKQLKKFDQSKAGKVKFECEKNVRLGYSIGPKYLSAWENWEHTDQHTNTIPASVDVPVFFWYLNADNGHVGVRLANGTFWSDGIVYGNIAAYEGSHTPDYRGWSTHLDGVAVIEYVADPPKPKMPPIGSRIHLTYPPAQTRTTWKAGTATKAGTIHVTDNTFDYVVRGYDSKFPGRIIINSASGGGDGVGLALYYLSGSVVPGWKAI